MNRWKGGVMEKDYPVKMNYGCFLPLIFFAVIGLLHCMGWINLN